MGEMAGVELQVLVAHDSPQIALEIDWALASSGWHTALVHTGQEALHRLIRDHPRVLVVDVALPGRAPFELCDDISQAGLRTRVILVASVYNRTRYKRQPSSLYGADDYVEQHHIHDMLPAKVAQLLDGAAPPAASQGPPERVAYTRDVDPAAAERLRRAGDALLQIRYDTPEEGRQRAARLSELLVADVALYNGDGLRGVRDATELPDQVRNDLEEARAILGRLVPPEILGTRDWIGEYVVNLLQRMPRSR